MNAAQIFQNLDCLTDVEAAACHYYDNVRGLTVRQQFFILPDDTIVALNSVDGGYSTIVLSGDDVEIFRARHSSYFQ